jgi:Uma2 family endonuclease
MAMPASAHHYWTPADVLAEFPESTSSRYECVDGELFVTPAARSAHVVAQQRLATLFASVIEPDDLLARVIVTLADLRLGSDALVQPDLFILDRPLRSIARWEDMPRPLLVAEVLSPSTALVDRGRKRRLYQRAGVLEYWIVDLDAQCIERWTPSAEFPETHRDQLCWVDPVSHATVTVDVADFFARVLEG